MDSQVTCQLRVKGRQQELSVSNQDRVVIVFSEDLAAGVTRGSFDNGGPDEYAVEGAVKGSEEEVLAEAVNLPAVGVSTYLYVYELKTFRPLGSFAQQDGSGTGAENRQAAAPCLAQGREKSTAKSEVLHGGAFAPWNDQPVKPLEISRLAYLPGPGTAALQAGNMKRERPLQGKHPDKRFALVQVVRARGCAYHPRL